MTVALFVSDNTMKIMKYSKYVQVTTLIVWYVLVSYSWKFRKLEEVNHSSDIGFLTKP